MNFARFLSEECIKLVVDSSWYEDIDPEKFTPHLLRQKKDSILTDLANLLAASGKVSNASKLSTSLINNDRKFSSAIGSGLAIPHVRCMQSRNLVMGFARCMQGVEFDAPDKQKVQIFIAMIAPHYNDSLYLRVYRSIAEAFLNTPVKEELLAVDEAEPGKIIHTFNQYFV